MSSLCKARILVVDDDPRVSEDLKVIFNSYRVEAAEGVGESLIESAKKMARCLRPQVVIMDYWLFGETFTNDESGLELLKTKEFSSAQCVLYSAHLDEPLEIVRKARKDVQFVVSKYELPEKLIAVVEEALQEGCACRQGFHPRWPSEWDSERVIKTIFGNNTQVPSDAVYDVLGRLFPEHKELVLRMLGGSDESEISLPRGHSVIMKAMADDRGPYVIKLGSQDRITMECSAYKNYVEGRLGGTPYAQLHSRVIFWDLGGIRYSFIGLTHRPIMTFNSFYRKQKEAGVILKPLQHFFGETWHPHYFKTRAKLKSNLIEAYDPSMKLLNRLEEFPNQEEDITFKGVPVKLPNPVRWVLRHQADSEIVSATEAVTHGDLHGDNLFAQGELSWVIDFERTGLGPILRDFVKLEHDIVSRSVQFPSDDLLVFFQFAVALTAPESVDESIDLPAHLKRHTELEKACGVINGLRRMALAVSNYEDVGEYYWGLLLNCLPGHSVAERDSIQRQHSLLLGAMLCERLRRLGNVWPPPRWDRHLYSQSKLQDHSERENLNIGVTRTTYDDKDSSLGLTPASVSRKHEEEVVEMLRKLERISLREYIVVGKYLRHDPQVRNELKDWVQRIKAPLLTKTRNKENYLIWAAPGSGKTFLIQQIYESIRGSVDYVECNLAKDTREDFTRKVINLKSYKRPVLCLLDEIDARGDEVWPYDVCFSQLDLNADTDQQVVIVLIGSTHSGIKSMASAMQERNKGKDLVSRILLEQNSFEIPGPAQEDSVVMVIGQIIALAEGVQAVEKLALSYILCNEHLSNSPRQLSEFIKAAATRLKEGEERLRYHHLFHPGADKAYEFRNSLDVLLKELKDVDVQIYR